MHNDPVYSAQKRKRGMLVGNEIENKKHVLEEIGNAMITLTSYWV